MDTWTYLRPKTKDNPEGEKRIVEIVFNKQEEEAVQKYADKHNITYGQAVQTMMDAMTKGLVDLAVKDGEFENIRDQKTTTKVETLDSDAPDSDNS